MTENKKQKRQWSIRKELRRKVVDKGKMEEGRSVRKRKKNKGMG